MYSSGQEEYDSGLPAVSEPSAGTFVTIPAKATFGTPLPPSRRTALSVAPTCEHQEQYEEETCACEGGGWGLSALFLPFLPFSPFQLFLGKS